MPGMTKESAKRFINDAAASMRPRLNAGDDHMRCALRTRDCVASMRPRLNAGDDTGVRSENSHAKRGCFNEAPAKCRG